MNVTMSHTLYFISSYFIFVLQLRKCRQQRVNRFSKDYTETSNRAVVITIETRNFPLIFLILKQTREMSLVDRSQKPLIVEFFALGSHKQTLFGLT